MSDTIFWRLFSPLSSKFHVESLAALQFLLTALAHLELFGCTVLERFMRLGYGSIEQTREFRLARPPTSEFNNRFEIHSTVEPWSENSRLRRLHSANLPSCFLVLASDLFLCPALHGLGLTIPLLARSWRFASLAVYARLASALFLGTRIAACSAATDHPPRRCAPPLRRRGIRSRAGLRSR